MRESSRHANSSRERLTKGASETLGYASVDLDSRRYRVKTEICSNVELHIREDRPRQRCVEAQLRGLDNGIIIVICPEFRVGGDVFDDLSAEIHIKDDVGMSAIVGTVPERVDLRDQQKGKVVGQTKYYRGKQTFFHRAVADAERR